jgi:nucleoside-diphosphate-sugar epimerase
MFCDAPAILLTGATGLVGSELLYRLLTTRPDCIILAPTRSAARVSAPPQDPRVRWLQCDLADPHFDGWEDRVEQIIHCAAETRFGLPLEKARSGNVSITQAVLNLARRCGNLRRFSYISTVYVAGRSTGRLPELPATHESGFCNTYQQSKYEAEALVVAAMAEIPAAIYRLSSIVSDSRGAVRQFNYVHQLLRLFPKNFLPVAPIDPHAPVDLICTDWLAPALLHLIEKQFTPGKIFQVCAGPEASLTAGEMIDLNLAAFTAAGYTDLRVPKFVSLAEYDEEVIQMRKKGDRLLNEVLRIIGYSLPHLGLHQAFDNQNTTAGLAGSDIEPPPIRDYYTKVVEYCIRTGWGRTPDAVPAAAEASAR